MGSSLGERELEREASSGEVDSPSRRGARGHRRLGEPLGSAPPLDARPPRGGARGRGRAHPSHPRGSPSRRAGQEFTQPGQSGGCALHVVSGRRRGRQHPRSTQGRRLGLADPRMRASAWSARVSVTVVPGVTMTRRLLSFRTLVATLDIFRYFC